MVAKQELDNAQTAYDAAVAQLQSLTEQVSQQQVELHYYRVAAPMAGIVGDIPVREGDRVTVATLLTTVDEPGSLEAYIYVPAERGREVKPGLAGAFAGRLRQSGERCAHHFCFAASGYRHANGSGQS